MQFQLSFRRGQRRHAQREMTKAGQLVVAAFRQGRIGGIDFKPDVRQRNQTGRRILAVVPDGFSAQDTFIPGFQSNRISRRDGDVLNVNIHAFPIHSQIPSRNLKSVLEHKITSLLKSANPPD